MNREVSIMEATLNFLEKVNFCTMVKVKLRNVAHILSIPPI